jgi:hypothetical protein
MSRNGELEAGLKRIADDYHLPGGGRKKLSQLVAEHLDWFDAAEKHAMGWRDMIRALTAAGVTCKRGKPLSIGTLSSARRECGPASVTTLTSLNEQGVPQPRQMQVILLASRP